MHTACNNTREVKDPSQERTIPTVPQTPHTSRQAKPVPPAAQRTQAAPKVDRRSLRSQQLLRDALASELRAGEDLSRITVAALTDRAGLTRRTFYSHYRDIPDFIEQIEQGILSDIRDLISRISAASLADLYENIDCLEPAPGSVELLAYLKDRQALIGALLGPGGDPAFIKRLIDLAREAVADRMQNGIFPGVVGALFDYYLSYVVSAEVGVVQRWFETGLAESPETLARIMTVIAFVRPGDLYGKPIDINIPAYGLKLMGLNFHDASGGAEPPEGPPGAEKNGARLVDGAHLLLRAGAQTLVALVLVGVEHLGEIAVGEAHVLVGGALLEAERTQGLCPRHGQSRPRAAKRRSLVLEVIGRHRVRKLVEARVLVLGLLVLVVAHSSRTVHNIVFNIHGRVCAHGKRQRVARTGVDAHLGVMLVHQNDVSIKDRRLIPGDLNAFDASAKRLARLEKHVVSDGALRRRSVDALAHGSRLVGAGLNGQGTQRRLGRLGGRAPRAERWPKERDRQPS